MTDTEPETIGQLIEATSIYSRFIAVETENGKVTNIDIMSKDGELFELTGEMDVESMGYIGKPRHSYDGQN